MTVDEMRVELDLLVYEGYKDAEIFFDTEAGAFNFHIAKVDTIHSLSEELNPEGKKIVTLHTHDPIIHGWRNRSSKEKRIEALERELLDSGYSDGARKIIETELSNLRSSLDE